MEKTLFIYWNDGFDNCPDVVKACLESWKKHNKNYKIIELNDRNLKEYIDIKEYIPEIDNKNITNTAMSDIIRIFLLKKYGGFWVDSTVFCMKPLDDWISPYIKNGFFGFQQYLNHIKLSSWFLYGEKGSYLIEKWHENVINYINNTQKIGVIVKPNKTVNEWKKGDRENHYFWFHYLFSDIYNSDKQFKSIWDGTKKLSTIPSHYIQEIGFYKLVSKEFILKYEKISPVFKLTYKYDKTRCKNNSIINYLIFSLFEKCLDKTEETPLDKQKILHKVNRHKKIVLKRYISGHK